MENVVVQTKSVKTPNFSAVGSDSLSKLALICLVGFVLIGPLSTPQNLGDQELAGEGSALRQISYAAIFCAALICSRPKNIWQTIQLVPLSIRVVLIWCTASLLWSSDPEVALRRLALTAVIIFSVFALTEKVGYKSTVAAIRLALALLLVANYAAIILAPDLSIHQPTELDYSIVGAWHGVLPQKNFAGLVCALLIIFFAFDSKNLNLFVRYLFIAAAAYFLYRAQSKTSWALLLLATLVGTAFCFYRPYYKLLAFFSCAMLALGISIISYLNLDELSALLDNEQTLTGRVQIWPLLFEYWKEHPFTGSGFGSFWNVSGPQPIAKYTEGWITAINSGHNGYLDLLAQLGLPGLGLVIIAAVIVPGRRLIAENSIQPTHRALLAAVIFFAIGQNLTESGLFDRDGIVHVFLMIAIALLNMQAGNYSAGTSDAR